MSPRLSDANVKELYFCPEQILADAVVSALGKITNERSQTFEGQVERNPGKPNAGTARIDVTVRQIKILLKKDPGSVCIWLDAKGGDFYTPDGNGFRAPLDNTTLPLRGTFKVEEDQTSAGTGPRRYGIIFGPANDGGKVFAADDPPCHNLATQDVKPKPGNPADPAPAAGSPTTTPPTPFTDKVITKMVDSGVLQALWQDIVSKIVDGVGVLFAFALSNRSAILHLATLFDAKDKDGKALEGGYKTQLIIASCIEPNTNAGNVTGFPAANKPRFWASDVLWDHPAVSRNPWDHPTLDKITRQMEAESAAGFWTEGHNFNTIMWNDGGRSFFPGSRNGQSTWTVHDPPLERQTIPLIAKSGDCLASYRTSEGWQGQSNSYAPAYRWRTLQADLLRLTDGTGAFVIQGKGTFSSYVMPFDWKPAHPEDIDPEKITGMTEEIIYRSNIFAYVTPVPFLIEKGQIFLSFQRSDPRRDRFKYPALKEWAIGLQGVDYDPMHQVFHVDDTAQIDKLAQYDRDYGMPEIEKVLNPPANRLLHQLAAPSRYQTDEPQFFNQDIYMDLNKLIV